MLIEVIEGDTQPVKERPVKERPVKERPILFTGEMVQALLNGQKTQTRRLLKPQPEPFAAKDAAGPFWHVPYRGWPEGRIQEDHMDATLSPLCPYGKVGDWLWVRETWAYWGGDEHLYQQQPEHVIYRADPPRGARDMICHLGQKWKPSIFMPRWASRLALEITDVRAERVGDIREHDALAEGAHHWLMSKPGRAYDNAASAACRWTKWLDPEARVCSHRGEFAALWDGINGKNPGRSFKESPWVWVLGFRRAEDGEGTGRAD